MSRFSISLKCLFCEYTIIVVKSTVNLSVRDKRTEEIDSIFFIPLKTFKLSLRTANKNTVSNDTIVKRKASTYLMYWCLVGRICPSEQNRCSIHKHIYCDGNFLKVFQLCLLSVTDLSITFWPKQKKVKIYMCGRSLQKISLWISPPSKWSITTSKAFLSSTWMTINQKLKSNWKGSLMKILEVEKWDMEKYWSGKLH